MLLEPRATYRLQLRPDFGFAKAAALLPYIARLGVSHVYCSPIWQAAPGSTHGYDVVDPEQVNSELGGAQAFQKFVETLQQHRLGLLLDIVPNHMAIRPENPWWQDVLQHGVLSRYARYFDVDWDMGAESGFSSSHNRIPLPVLRDHYGRVLEAGEIILIHDHGQFFLRYAKDDFPVDPAAYDIILRNAAAAASSNMLAFLADVFGYLAYRSDAHSRQRDLEVLQRLLTALCRDRKITAAIDEEVSRINADFDALDALIERQNYRLAFWRLAGQELTYRRFFDIHTLAGLRIEDPDVFDAVHRQTLKWLAAGWVDGLRVDHPDGMRDPAEYFQRLNAAVPDAWLLAEKILMPEEKLPSDWPVAGTTGYEYLNLAAGLMVDPAGLATLGEFYSAFTGINEKFSETVRVSKLSVASDILGSELNRLVLLMSGICERHRRHRDYTRQELTQAIRELAACFPVYRSYLRAQENSIADADRSRVNVAMEQAKKNCPDLDPELFRFLRDILLLRINGESEKEFTLRFQQFTAPLMAKGVEDTALFRSVRLVCCNEVGAEPENYPIAPAEFHRACHVAKTEHPLGLLATDTHDTKYSSDVRARLALLSEMPERWAKTVQSWSQALAHYKHGEFPDHNIEYLFYQALVGAWPISMERLLVFMEKAAREAKQYTSWLQQDAEYERALREFVRSAMQDEAFMRNAESFIKTLIEPGRVNSLAQTLLKFTAPGVPDIYQGTELWEFSLVDPDNRRAVDFDKRRELFTSLTDNITPEQVLEAADSGLPKLWLTRQALRVRAEYPAAFGRQGRYEPLTVQGEKSTHAIAFARDGDVAVLTPRLVLGLNGDWADTSIHLPDGEWRNRLTHENRNGGRVKLGEMLRRFPVALLTKTNSGARQ